MVTKVGHKIYIQLDVHYIDKFIPTAMLFLLQGLCRLCSCLTNTIYTRNFIWF